MLSQEELDKLLEEGATEGDQAEKTNEAEPAKQNPDTEPTEASAQDEQNADTETAGQPESSDTADQAKDDGGGDDLDWSDAFQEAAEGGDTAAAKAVKEAELNQPKASAPEFSDFAKSPSPPTSEETGPNLDFIMDLPLEVSVELGRAKMQIRELLKLAQGSVVELNKLAGEPAEIYVNSKLMAKGEVVVINEKFGIKLTEIISPADRVKSLG